MTVYTLGLNTGNTGGCEDASLVKSSAGSNFGSSVYFQVGVYRRIRRKPGRHQFTGMQRVRWLGYRSIASTSLVRIAPLRLAYPCGGIR